MPSSLHRAGHRALPSDTALAVVAAALVLAALPSLAAGASAAAAADCSWWYEETAHGSLPGGGAVFVDAVRDAGAVGDGVTDDTAALLRALDANATGGGGSGLARSARVVYLRAGTYLVRDTLTVWFWTQLVGNPLPGCASTLLLAASAPGFGDKSGLAMKPVVAANGGFNSTPAPGSWQVVERTRGGHANDLFYASVRDLSIVVSADNAGAVALYWPVAQQTAVRNVKIDLSASGAIGLDMEGEGYAPAGGGGAAFVPSIGGGGQIDSLTVSGGRYSMRLAGSQWTYTNIGLSGASEACVHSSGMIWSHTFVRLRVSQCPVGLALTGAIGAVLLVDSLFGPTLGPSAIVTDGKSAVVMQNVVLDVFSQQTHFLIDEELPAPELCCLKVGSWARGPVFLDGARADKNASGRLLPLPSRDAARDAGVPLLCPNPATQVPNLCGGSAEDPDSGITLDYRPSFAGRAVANARTDFGAVGDGVADDTDALRTALARSNAVTFLPFGVYAVRAGELVLGCNATVVGEALSTIALFAGAAPQLPSDAALLAMLASPADASCSATLVDLSLSTLGPGNDGAVLLDHQSGAGSYVADVTMRLAFSVGLKARLGHVGGAPGTGAGQLSNAWFWGMDHNLTDMGEMNCTAPTCADHRPPGQVRGVSIGTRGPLFMLATNFEHSNASEYAIEAGAANVVGSVIQTEGSLVSLNISGAAGPVVFFGGLFGSGSGHNATLYAQRGPRGAACAGGVDVSYRLLGAMVKQPLNFSLVDTTPGGRGFAAPAPASATGWELGSFVNSC